jgi:2-phospho-L-lactate guanylyltransferase
MDSHGNSKGAQVTVVIAVRGGADAKSRLRPVLGKAGCSALVGAMLGDMVAALQSSATVGRIIVVTPTPELANGLGVEILADPQQGGINAAFAHANRIISGPALHLPGDLPELDAASIDALLSRFKPGGVVLVPSITDGGTGALLVDAAGVEMFAFGPDSLERHCAAARALSLVPAIVENVALAHDLDRPEQLARATQFGGPRTRALLAELLPERQAA